MDTCLDILLSEWTILIAIGLYLFYDWATYNFDYFKLRNIPYVKPIPVFGNLAGRLFFKESFLDFVLKTYNQFKGHRFYGTFELRNPELYITDPEILKLILVKDSNYFINHRMIADEKSDPIFGNFLFLLKDEKWKDMRRNLSPLFTKSKLSAMFEFIKEICQPAIENIKTEIKNNQPDIELKSFFTRFANDAIYTTAFGLKIDSFAKKDNEYFRNGTLISGFSKWFTIKYYLFYGYNSIMKFFNMKLFDQQSASFFRNLVVDTMTYRYEHNIIRPDLINILMEVRKGTTKDDQKEEIDTLIYNEESTIPITYKAKNREWSDDELVAQCVLFFMAGYETISHLLAFCAAELVENPDVQKRILEEIYEIKKELNGEPLNYEKLSKMEYLQQTLLETLRKWPPFESTNRLCVKPYFIHDEKTGEKHYIEPGLTLVAPIVGLHRDPQYFPNPEKFDPERFNEYNKSKIKPFTYLPFGGGPRSCIGFRLALMECKTILYYILSEFTLEVATKTISIKPSSTGMKTVPGNGLWVRFKPIV